VGGALGPEQFAFDAGCQHEIEASPEPGAPVTVGLDGGYIRGRERRPGGTGCFEVIAGKSIPEEGPAKVFAGVGRIDMKPKRRLHEVLQSQGVLPRQRVTFLSDGGDTVRELPAYLHPHSEHILDWFHIAMRVEQLSQTARGFRGTYDCPMTNEEILKELERVKWYLWHGKVFRADETLTDLMFEVDGAIEEDREASRPAHLILKKLARALEEFGTYIDNNASGIVNYGERHRCGERISTGFVESTINQLVAKGAVSVSAAATCQSLGRKSIRRTGRRRRGAAYGSSIAYKTRQTCTVGRGGERRAVDSLHRSSGRAEYLCRRYAHATVGSHGGRHPRAARLAGIRGGPEAPPRPR
jgi:hypothetical protein